MVQIDFVHLSHLPESTKEAVLVVIMRRLELPAPPVHPAQESRWLGLPYRNAVSRARRHLPGDFSVGIRPFITAGFIQRS